MGGGEESDHSIPNQKIKIKKKENFGPRGAAARFHNRYKGRVQTWKTKGGQLNLVWDGNLLGGIIELGS